MTPPAPVFVPIDVHNPPQPRLALSFRVTCHGPGCANEWHEPTFHVAMLTGDTYCSQECYDARMAVVGRHSA